MSFYLDWYNESKKYYLIPGTLGCRHICWLLSEILFRRPRIKKTDLTLENAVSYVVPEFNPLYFNLFIYLFQSQIYKAKERHLEVRTQYFYLDSFDAIEMAPYIWYFYHKFIAHLGQNVRSSRCGSISITGYSFSRTQPPCSHSPSQFMSSLTQPLGTRSRHI